MSWSTPDSIRSAQDANARLRRQSDAYRSTTEPLNRISDTLKDILNELRKINEKLRND